MRFNIFIMMATIALTGCSAKELYDAGKASRKQNCERLPVSEREQCFKEINNKSYKEYERERKKISVMHPFTSI